MKKFTQLAFPYIVWAILMLVFPMVLIALYSVTDQGNSILSFTFTLEHYAKFFTDPDFLLILWRSIVIAVKTTVICLLLGYPIAYYIARSEQKKQNALILVITIPMWINFLPFMILQIQTSLSKMDNSLLEASADLGASPAQTFKRVTLPLSVPGIINGITLVFLPAVSSFFIPKLLGGGQYFLIGNMIENQFITVGEWNFGSAISMIMAVIMMVLMMVVRKIEIRNQGGKGV